MPTPRFCTGGKARVMSISLTSLVPSTIDGKVEILPEMPKRCAMSAMVPKPSASPILALTVLIDRAKASRRLTGPRWCASSCAGSSRRSSPARRRSCPEASSPIQGGQIDEQLEGRSRLAFGLGRAIVDRIDIVATADHRLDGTVTVDRNLAPCVPGGE